METRGDMGGKNKERKNKKKKREKKDVTIPKIYISAFIMDRNGCLWKDDRISAKIVFVYSDSHFWYSSQFTNVCRKMRTMADIFKKASISINKRTQLYTIHCGVYKYMVEE